MYFAEDYGPMATMSDAHAEWHRNAGVPMGQPGCPQDACHPVDDYEPEPGEGEGVKCGHCKGRHWTVSDVKACSVWGPAPVSHREVPAEVKADVCVGRPCEASGYRCSKHSWEYQQKWGRAENE